MSVTTAAAPGTIRSSAAHEAPAPGSLVRLALLASIAISFLAASAAPTPLYQHYDLVWHGTALTTTEAFGVYAIAVLGGLLVFGSAATHVGRRPVLLAAIALQIASLLLFATAGSYEPLFIGRVLQGFAAGAALGTLGAAMIEAHQSHGTIASSAAPFAGTGLGALTAGIAVSYLPWPTHLIYLGLSAVLALQAVGVITLLHPTATQPGLIRSLRPQVAVPSSARTAFAAAAPAAFATWAVAGLFGSLGPAVLHAMSPDSPSVLGGLALFEVAIIGSIATIAVRSWEGRRQLTWGLSVVIVGIAALAVMIAAGTIAGFIAAAVIVGIGFGSALQGSIRTTVPLVEAHERAGLLAAVYLVSYAGMGIPAVGAGY
ncbi:MAG: MFS transporter, partial [Nocardioides sp.]